MSDLEHSCANISAKQCFALTPPETQVACSSQHLNITDPPSIYSYKDYRFLWEPVTCMLSNVTYPNRINVPDDFNWCSVPLKGSDAFLFVSLALTIAGCLFGKLSAVWVLIAGGAIGALNNYINLLQISNGIAIWLGISPPNLFFFAFLPPLLVDSAIRIDFFMFSKVDRRESCIICRLLLKLILAFGLGVHILMMAFVMVIMGTVILTPIILFVLGFSSRGFTWVHCALFASMIASTDALAATAILKQGGGPEKLVVLMEGEALLNDASAITLFEVFMHILEAHPGVHDVPTVWSAIPTIIEDILELASIGAGVGLGMSIATGYLLRWLRWRGAKPSVEITIILAVAYMSFYVGQSPAQGSGVISVVVFGLWGNYTSKWGMLASTEESGSFDAFWDTLSFASNGLVFFWAGVASVNYFIRSMDILGGNAWSYAAIPLIYISMMLIRTACLALFNVSIFAWFRKRLGWTEVLFTGWSGLRGAISLIMTADFIANSAFLQGNINDPTDPMRALDRVNSDIAIWTASFVMLTLVINAPSISMVMGWLHLDRITTEKQAMRAKAKRALLRFTGAAINTLREDDEEFLQGANWEAVGRYVDVSGALKKFDPPPSPPGAGAVTIAAGLGGEDDSGGGKEGASAGEAGAKVPEQSLKRKSMVRSVSQILAPRSPFMTTAQGATDDGAETDTSHRAGGASGRFRSIFLSPAQHPARSSVAMRQRVRRTRHRRPRDVAGHPFSSGAGFSSGDDTSGTDFDESDTSGCDSDTSIGGGGASALASPHRGVFTDDGGNADLLLGEVVEECPFIQSSQQRRTCNSLEEQKEEDGQQKKQAAGPEGSRDIEMGLHSFAPVAAGTTATAGAAASKAISGVVEAASGAIATAGHVGLATAAAAAAAGAADASLPQSLAATPDEEEETSAEHLAFIRHRQQRQQRQRPSLGSLFAEQVPDSPDVLDGSFLGASSLQAIAEHQQAVPEQQPQVWYQQQPETGPGVLPPTSEAGRGNPELYYSSLPVAAGCQLKQQLHLHLLQRGALGAREGSVPPHDAGTAGEAIAGGTATASVAACHRHAASGDELYYSSMPATMGHQVAQQLRQEMAAAKAVGAGTGGSPRMQRPLLPPGDGGKRPSLGYYSSVPASVGRQMAQQLKQEQLVTAAAAAAAGGGKEQQGQGQRRGWEQEGADLIVAGSEDVVSSHYSSLSAATRRDLQRQLQQQLAAAKQGAAAGEEIQAAPKAKAELPSTAAGGAAAGGTNATGDHFSTMPAALGRSLQRDLAHELSQQAPSEAGTSRSGSMQQGSTTSAAAAGADVVTALLGKPGSFGDPRRPPRPSSLPPSPSREPLSQQPAAAAAAAAGMHPAAARQGRQACPAPLPQQQDHLAWEDYHRTVTGAAGPSLVAELQRQLSHKRGAGTTVATASGVGPLTGLPQRDLLGRKIYSRVHTGAASEDWLESPSYSTDLAGLMPLSARPAQYRTPSGDSSRLAFQAPAATVGIGAVLPAATPVSAHLQMWRERSMAVSRRNTDSGGPASFALPLPVMEGAGAGATPLHRGRDEVLGSLTWRSSGLPSHPDTSWQHKQLQAMRTLGRPNLHSTSASRAAGSEAGAEATSTPASAGGLLGGSAPASVLLSRTYSSMAPSSGGGSTTKAARAPSALARLSVANSAGSRPGSSVHSANAYNAAAAATAVAADAADAFVPSGTGSSSFSAGVLSEMRSRLIAGLKRYFHAKRMEGLLSVQGLRILEYACDHAVEHTSQSLGMWLLLEKEVAGDLATRFMARCLLLLARTWLSSPRCLQALTSWPVKKVSGFLRRLLGQRMLVSCEVAVEYYLSMVHSPQIQWLQQADEAWPLQQEVEVEVDAAYRFIIDREIEAPDRFQAIQSYRAAMAVLRQQLTFVQELYESGMVDCGEKDDMVAPLDKRMRHLEITGPVWKPPRPRAVLRSLPFMQMLPEELFQKILLAGSIKEQRTGVVFWASSDLPSLSGGAAGPGLYVVLSGVVRRVHQRTDGTVKEYFQGIGGVVGSLLAMTGTHLPGNETAVAEGNTLGKGPVLFHVPQAVAHEVMLHAAAGDRGASTLCQQLLRGAAAYVTESCESDVVEAVRLHLLQLAAAKAQRALKQRLARHASSLASSAAPSVPGSPRGRAGGQQQQQQTLHRKSSPGEEMQLGLRRSSSLARPSSRQQLQQKKREGAAAAAAEGADEEGVPSRRQSTGGLALHRSRTFGGQLAELMQQIAQEEFEEMNGGREHHLGQVEEGYEEAELASLHPSDGTAAGFGPSGGSVPDLPTMASTYTDAAAAVTAAWAPAANVYAAGHDSQPPVQLKQQGSAEQVGGGAAAAAAAAKAIGKSMRQRARAAERQAPQYAVEVLFDFKRGMTTGILLELPPGLAFSQTTHAVLLRGQLLAAGPPLLPGGDAVGAPPLHSPSWQAKVVGLPRAGMDGAVSRLSLSGRDALLGLRRISAAGETDWEAGLASMVAAAAAPVAPRLLPWLWNPRYRCSSGAHLAAEQPWLTGPQGALLLLCRTDGGEVPDGVEEAEVAADASAAEATAAAVADEVAADLQSHPLDLGTGGFHLGLGKRKGGMMHSASGAAMRQVTRVATFAAAPATRAATGLLRMITWQPRYSHGHDTTRVSEPDPADSSNHAPSCTGDSSAHGSTIISQSQQGELRLPLERLAIRRGGGTRRSSHSAR